MMQFQLDFGPAIEQARATFGSRLPELEKTEISDDALVVKLKDGRVISLPLTWYPKLKAATPDQRAKFEVLGSGYGVQWKELEVSISVLDLFAAGSGNRP
jgi:hypothetical protein